MKTAFNDIAVTGVAAISTAGVGTEPMLAAVESGISHLQPVPEEILGESGHLWGKAEGFRAADFMSPLKARKFDRCSLLAVVSAGMALKSAGIEPGTVDPVRVGIVLGCGFGGIAYADEFLTGYFKAGVEGLVPMLFPNIVPNASASNASIEYKLKGPNVTTIQRFCSAESAIMMAKRFIEEDRADVVLTGGVDEIYPGMVKGLQSIGQLKSYGAGFSEGAGIVVLEKASHARSRNARVLARMGEVRTIGRLSPQHRAEGLDRLIGADQAAPDLIALSGTATYHPELLERLPNAPTLDTGMILGRSLAMGGLAMTALVLKLAAGERGLHVGASPEGPYYAIDLIGGDPVSR